MNYHHHLLGKCKCNSENTKKTWAVTYPSLINKFQVKLNVIFTINFSICLLCLLESGVKATESFLIVDVPRKPKCHLSPSLKKTFKSFFKVWNFCTFYEKLLVGVRSGLCWWYFMAEDWEKFKLNALSPHSPLSSLFFRKFSCRVL